MSAWLQSRAIRSNYHCAMPASAYPSPPDTAHVVRRRRPVVIAVAVLLMALLFVVLTGMVDGGVGVKPERLLLRPLYPLANALPGLLAAGVLLVISRRLVMSFGLAFALQQVVYAVNALKAANLGTPLMPADFTMVGQLDKGGMHVLGAYLPHSPWPYLLMLAGIALLVLLWRLEPPLLPARTRGSRVITGLVLSALLVTLLGGLQLWGRLYNGRTLWLEPWSAVSTRNHSGLISSLMMYHLQYGHGRQKPNVAAAKQLLGENDAALRQRMAAAAAPQPLPDIVVVQSESYFDPARINGLEHLDLSPNLHRLAGSGQSGALYVPTFGGGTIRTEFEVLTGLALRYFGELQFPYLQLNAKVVPGLVRTLNARGYETVAIHGNDPSFWNRTSAFKAIGFNRFVSARSFPLDAKRDGKYMTDSAMTDEIMKQLRNDGPPQFLFAISLEAHGPYDTVPNDAIARDAEPVPVGVTGQSKLELQNYLYHIGHADAELGRLVKLLAQRERPSLVLFYGDHLPALVSTYQIAGFVDGNGMLSQPGTWLLVDPKHPGAPVHENLAAWMLPGTLLDAAGIHDDPYFALTQLLIPQLAALTRAPGAPPPAETTAVTRTDKDMASVARLRLSGKLAKLLPATAPAASSTLTLGPRRPRASMPH